MRYALGIAAAGCAVLALSLAVRAQDSAGGISSVQISAEGQQIYAEVCAACHMADARGGAGAGQGIPSLADNPNMADKAAMIEVLVKGRGGMPWFTDMLDAQQIAAVLTYVRNNFNAYPDPVTPSEVAAIAATAGGMEQ